MRPNLSKLTERCTWSLSANHRYDRAMTNQRGGQEALPNAELVFSVPIKGSEGIGVAFALSNSVDYPGLSTILMKLGQVVASSTGTDQVSIYEAIYEDNLNKTKL